MVMTILEVIDDLSVKNSIKPYVLYSCRIVAEDAPSC